MDLFSHFDKNRDGVIDRSEFDAWFGPKARGRSAGASVNLPGSGISDSWLVTGCQAGGGSSSSGAAGRSLSTAGAAAQSMNTTGSCGQLSPLGVELGENTPTFGRFRAWRSLAATDQGCTSDGSNLIQERIAQEPIAQGNMMRKTCGERGAVSASSSSFKSSWRWPPKAPTYTGGGKADNGTLQLQTQFDELLQTNRALKQQLDSLGAEPSGALSSLDGLEQRSSLWMRAERCGLQEKAGQLNSLGAEPSGALSCLDGLEQRSSLWMSAERRGLQEKANELAQRHHNLEAELSLVRSEKAVATSLGPAQRGALAQQCSALTQKLRSKEAAQAEVALQTSEAEARLARARGELDTLPWPSPMQPSPVQPAAIQHHEELDSLRHRLAVARAGLEERIRRSRECDELAEERRLDLVSLKASHDVVVCEHCHLKDEAAVTNVQLSTAVRDHQATEGALHEVQLENADQFQKMETEVQQWGARLRSLAEEVHSNEVALASSQTKEEAWRAQLLECQDQLDQATHEQWLAQAGRAAVDQQTALHDARRSVRDLTAESLS